MSHVSNIRFNDDSIEKIYPYTDSGLSGQLLREISSLKALTHPNIIKLIDIVIDTDTIKLIFPKLESQFLDFVMSPDFLNHKDDIIKNLIDTIKFIRYKAYVHGDLSFNNIMVDKNSNLFLIDFGGSTKIHRSANIVRPTYYIAPLNRLYNDTQITEDYSDTWALGCILYAIEVKKFLFMGMSAESQRSEIVNKLGIVKINNEWQNIDPIQRVKLREDLKHSKYMDIIIDMLRIKRTKYMHTIRDNIYEIEINDWSKIDDRLIEILTILIDMTNFYRTDLEIINMAFGNLFRLHMEYAIEITNIHITVMFRIGLKLITNNDIDTDTLKYLFPNLDTRIDWSKEEVILLDILAWDFDRESVYEYRLSNEEKVKDIIMSLFNEYHHLSVIDKYKYIVCKSDIDNMIHNIRNMIDLDPDIWRKIVSLKQKS